MQTKNPLLDEFAKAMETAMSLAQTAGEEAKAAFRAQGDRLAAELDLVRRDELDAVRDTLMAEIASLKAEVARLAVSTTTARQRMTPVEPVTPKQIHIVYRRDSVSVVRDPASQGF